MVNNIQKIKIILESMRIMRINFPKAVIGLLPLLILYILIILLLSVNILQNDEVNYIDYAHRLIEGNYFSDSSDVQLWWGPGYPLILVPFVALNSPLILIHLANAFFLYGGLLFFYSTLSKFLTPLTALIFSLLTGLYLPFLSKMAYVLTETFTYFLVFGLIYFYCSSIRDSELSKKNLFFASFFFGMLALTKVFYGYVIAACILLSILFFIIRRGYKEKRTFLISFLALIMCVPYLYGTYSLTGNVFYWGTSGGISLYWMSSPYAQDMGNWFHPTDVSNIPELYQNHGDFFNKISSLSEPQRDAAFKQQAIENIKAQPKKFFMNWLANISRLLFSFPFSYAPQRLEIILYIIPNAILLSLLLFSIPPAFINLNKIPFEINAILVFAFISFGGTSFVSGYARIFTPIVPFLLTWILFVVNKFYSIRIITE
jgi:hypothetical protein